MRIHFLAVAAALAAVPAAAQELPDHATFARVLDRYAHGSLVDYAGIQADPGDLEAYIAELGATSPAAIEAASHDTQLAFWINAYNSCAIKLVIDHYPIEKRGGLGGVVNAVRGLPPNSIQQIPDTWKAEFCPVAEKERSLDEIEHEIIRPMGDPRIHFAVNCASRSCPVLAAQPYVGDRVNEQLDAAVERFVADPMQYRLEREGQPVMHVNKVLDWYNEDFGGEEGVIELLMQYIPSDDVEYIQENGPARLSFEPYDWTLNDTAVFGTGQ